MSYTIELPPELQLHILNFATTTRKPKLDTEYHPFDHVAPAPTSTTGASHRKKRAWALVLVCRLWRELTLPSLYKSLTVDGTTRTDKLLQVLQTSAQRGPNDGYGRWVKRVDVFDWGVKRDELYDRGEPYPQDPTFLCDILSLCPQVEILVQRYQYTNPRSIADLDVSRIKYLDWMPPHLGRHISRGSYLFAHVLTTSAHLTYLSIGKLPRAPMLLVPYDLTLSSLTTLQIRTAFNFLPKLETWSFPKLKNIVTDSSLLWSSCSPILENPTIKVVELLGDSEFMKAEYLVPLLSTCLNLRELSYPIASIKPSSRFPTSYPSLQCVRFYHKANPEADGDDFLTHVERHFSMFRRVRFPALKRIVLHGCWRRVLESHQFRTLYWTLQQEGIQLDLEDGLLCMPITAYDSVLTNEVN